MSRRFPRPAPELPPAAPFRNRRAAAWLAAGGLFAATFFGYAGASWAPALYRLLTDGPILVAWLAAMLGAGALLAKGFRIEHESVGFATIAALGIGAVSLLTLGLGLAGVLTPRCAWAIVITGIVSGPLSRYSGGGLGWGRFGVLPRRSEIQEPPPRPSPGVPGEGDGNPPRLFDFLNQRIAWTAWLHLIFVPFLAIAVLGALIPPGLLWGDEPNGYDVVEYHLQVPREWFEAGRILPLHHNVFSYFPFNVETHYLLAMHLRGGPWAGMYLAQLMHVAMVVLSVLAIREILASNSKSGLLKNHVSRASRPCFDLKNHGRDARDTVVQRSQSQVSDSESQISNLKSELQPRPPGTPLNQVLALLLAATIPWLTLLAPVAYNEGGLLLFGTLAIGWTLRAVTHEEHRPRRMALAGVMAGLACGVKLTAAPMLLAPIPVLFVLVLWNRRQPALRAAAVFAACGLAAFSPWLLRNFLWTHNPVFPEAMSLLGKAHFTPEQVERWRLAYVPDLAHRSIAGRFTAAWEQIVGDWRYGFVLLPLGLFAFASARKTAESLFLILMLSTWFVFWLCFTHLQSRFFVLSIPVLSLLAARLDARFATPALAGGFVLQAVAGFLGLHVKFTRRIEPLLVAVGIDHYPLLDERLSLVQMGWQRLYLVGGANAFVYEVPMTRLHYRTVFDVNTHGRDAVTAFTGDDPGINGDIHYIDYDELRRFARTYYAIPMPPEGLQGRAVEINSK